MFLQGRCNCNAGGDSNELEQDGLTTCIHTHQSFDVATSSSACSPASTSHATTSAVVRRGAPTTAGTHTRNVFALHFNCRLCFQHGTLEYLHIPAAHIYKLISARGITKAVLLKCYYLYQPSSLLNNLVKKSLYKTDSYEMI